MEQDKSQGLNLEEKQVIIDLLSRVQISPLDPNAIKSIELIQSIMKKLGKQQNEEVKIK